ncbi:hypothetical protein KI688_002138 [Linnemannia hyalina]|uniref:Uncharacterized protein n=1 Tax=Linnemannia hyalina TaxID=64524 RepID=A0A9P7XRJ6_9FUNG|nr:hypothetical protein KI688_002138 [Linnemannia hyalina]
MDPLSTIPIECLQLILTILQQDCATITLAAFACTNKHITSDYLFHIRHLKLARPHQGLFFSKALDPPELATCVQSDAEFDQVMQLRSLTIPLSLIERYLTAVGRFEFLDTVDFMSDIAYSLNYEDNDESARATYCHHGCDMDTAMQILKLLPPAKITRLEGYTWSQYIAHPLKTDLGQIDGIRCVDRGNPWIQRIQDNPLIIQRSRSLKTLELISPGQGDFRWAVQEKRHVEGFVSITFRNSLYYRQSGQEAPTQHGIRWPYWQQELLLFADVKIR